MPSFSKLSSMAKSAAGMSDDSKFIKLVIVGHDKDGGELGTYTSNLNPNQITHTLKNQFTTEKPINTSAPEKKFVHSDSQTLKFKLKLDGTGATGEKVDVGAEIAKFSLVTYHYNGTEHEPPYVKISYGSNIEFEGRLQDLNITYEMFKANGDPLRASLDATFIGSLDKELEAKLAGRSSPDLSHLVMVKEGDNLPMMCQRIYGDSSRYLDVARVNNLTNFRSLKAGTELLFPPIR